MKPWKQVWLWWMGLVATGASTSFGAEPMWIGPERTVQRATVGTRFSLPSRPRSAFLRVGTDFCTAKVELNGRTVAIATPYDLPIAISVHRWCVSGENSLRIELTGDGGPVAVAAELQLAFDDQRVNRTIYSDSTWVTTQDSTGPSSSVLTFGSAAREPWWHLRERPRTTAFDEYNQWQEAKQTLGTSHIAAPEDYEVEVVYQVPLRYGSWISMTIDDRGRILAGRESSGITRLSIDDKGTPHVEVVNEDLKGCHGVLWLNGSLLVNASDSKALYRLQDTDGDDSFDAIHLLRRIPGGGGDHGRNQLLAGQGSTVYSIQGDAVDLPDGFSSQVPITVEFEDGRPKGGHLIRTDANGRAWEVVASGLRNPYSVDMNRDGELFTYDADSERHVGLPWYRPTRMNHLVAGTDYGWRSRGELPWPIYHADILPPNVLIGRGSPTVVKFGYESHFPPPYDRVLFAGDWSFGRVFAVHVVPRGASYSMHPEVFLRGRPLNVVDIEFDSDGAMYLLTGGYKTRSVLYKIRYVGPKPNASQPLTLQQSARHARSAKMRLLRQRLERLPSNDEAVELAWSHLDHADRWIRHAARILLERTTPTMWQDRIWSDPDPEVALNALLALVRVSNDLDVQRVWSYLTRQLSPLPPRTRLVAMRVAQWLDDYHDDLPPREFIRHLEQIYPTGELALNREMCSFLVKHGSNDVVPKTLKLLGSTTPRQDTLHFLMALSTTSVGWNDSTRLEYFRLLQGAEHYQGDEGLPGVVRQIQDDALANVPPSDRSRFASLLTPVAAAGEEPIATRPFVRRWSMEDFRPEQIESATGDPVIGERVFHQAQCSRCHRLGAAGRSLGPDLSGIANRFRRQEILESILVPSRSIASRFVNHVVLTKDGKQHTGQVVWNGFRKSVIRLAPDPTRLDQTIEISKHNIESQQPSPTSPMPEGLLDGFERAEIIGLLVYMESGKSRQMKGQRD